MTTIILIIKIKFRYDTIITSKDSSCFKWDSTKMRDNI